MYIIMGNSNSYKKHDDMMNYIEDRLDNLTEKVSNNSNILRQMNNMNSKMSNDILEMKKKILNNKNIFEKLVKQDNLQSTDDIINNIILESDTWLPDDTEKTLLRNSVQVVLQVLQRKLLHEREK